LKKALFLSHIFKNKTNKEKKKKSQSSLITHTIDQLTVDEKKTQQPRRMLSGKKILISGASSGIGRATAVLCAREGARVFATGRSAEKLAVLQAEIQCAGVLAADLTEDAAARRIVEAAGGGTWTASPRSSTAPACWGGRLWQRRSARWRRLTPTLAPIRVRFSI
jgi:hypothetical protein